MNPGKQCMRSCIFYGLFQEKFSAMASFYANLRVPRSLHDNLDGIRIEYGATYDLPRAGFYLYLRPGRAALQRLAFAGGDKADAARLGAYTLAALY